MQESEPRATDDRAEQYIEALGAVTQVLAAADTVEEAVPSLLPALGGVLGWDVAAWWVMDGGALHCRELWAETGLRVEAFERLSRELAFASGEGLPGRVLETGKPAWIVDVMSDGNFPRWVAAAEMGLHSAVCLPVFRGDEVRGTIEFFTRRPRQPDEQLTRLMESITIQVGRFFAVLEERALAMAKLASLALTDELTGLANRRAWEDGVERELARARRDKSPLCLALLDFDHFKEFNDEHGHLAGDALLRETAAAWQEQIRTTDLLARYGGEEFAFAFPAWPIDMAQTVVERLRAVVPQGQTCSAGLVAWDGDEDAAGLLSRADAALYEAKRAGRDRTVTG